MLLEGLSKMLAMSIWVSAGVLKVLKGWGGTVLTLPRSLHDRTPTWDIWDAFFL